MKKVLLINGSPHRDGNTAIALKELAAQLAVCGVESELYWSGTGPLYGCVACNGCNKTGNCVMAQDVNELAERLRAADGLIVGSPVYYAGPTGTLCAFLDRLFRAHSAEFDGKPAAAVAVCRRGGASATFDRLNKYITYNQTPVVTSVYWNSTHGRKPEDLEQDKEGLQVMRTLGRNMVQMLQLERLNGQTEPRVMTDYIR